MKVLIWSQYFWPENFLINKMAIGLKAQGVEVTVVTGKPNYPDGQIFPGYKASGIEREEYFDVEVIRIPLYPRGKGSTKELLMNYLSFIFSGYFFAPFALRGRKFNAVFVYAPSPLLQALPAIFVAWLKNASMIVWVQDIWPEALQATGFIKNRWLLRLVESVVRYIYRHSNFILIQSEAFRASVERLVSTKNKIHFFPNCTCELTDTPPILSELQSQTVAEIKRHFSVVFAGNIGVAQSCETIVAAAKLLAEHSVIKFYLVGSGSRSNSIEHLLKSKKVTNVVMVGRLPAEEMNSVFSAASVLLVSLKNEPALSATIPSKLQSYLSAGKPIIASLNGEAAKLVIDANAGLSCPAENPDALSKAVLKLYNMSDVERDQLGRNARHYFKTHFNMADRIREFIDHLHTLVDTS
jgi:glycosyltransferase involved in cell wall biosynthesis